MTNGHLQDQIQPDARAKRPDGQIIDIFVTEGEGMVSARGILNGREVLGGVGPSKREVLYVIGVDLGDRQLIREHSLGTHTPGWTR